MRWRVVYGVLWILALIAYSVPWASTSDGRVFYGWNFTISFSITYLIGLLLGLVVLAIKWHPVSVTIVAGILMILGIVGASFGLGIAKVLWGLAGVEIRAEGGIGLAFIISLIYMVGGAIIGKRMIITRGE